VISISSYLLGLQLFNSVVSVRSNTHLLTNSGMDANQYEADEVFLSADSNVLFASTRFRSSYRPSPPSRPSPPPRTSRPPPRPTQQPGRPDDDDDDDDRRAILATAQSNSGYITAILLSSLSEEESPLAGRATGAGFPVKLLFQIPSSTSGGLTNSVSPAPWSNDYFAQVDSEAGGVEVSN
jgi:hypothetical protein